MTRKKQRTCEAKTLRRMVKGVTLPQSVQLVKAMSDTFAFLDLLKRYGFQYGEVVTGYCPSDHGPEGYYSVLKNNIPAGKIPFNCCGIYIEEVRVVNKTLQEIVAARVVEQNQVPVTQYKLTCGYLPHEEQCEYQGNCGGCEYAEPVADKKALPCGYFSAGQCGSFDGTCEGCQYAETAQMCSAGSECGRDGRIKREGLKW